MFTISNVLPLRLLFTIITAFTWIYESKKHSPVYNLNLKNNHRPCFKHFLIELISISLQPFLLYFISIKCFIPSPG